MFFYFESNVADPDPPDPDPPDLDPPPTFDIYLYLLPNRLLSQLLFFIKVGSEG
jgi:hypothetical protein